MNDIQLHFNQSKPMRDLFVTREFRNVVVVASRGFGKSYLAAAASLQAVSELSELPRNVPNKNVDLIAPTFKQVKEIYLPLFTDTFGLGMDKRVKITQDGFIRFPKGVTLNLRTYEGISSMRGKGSYFTVCDEPSDWKSGDGFMSTYDTIIEPCLTTRWSQKDADRINKQHGTNLSAGRVLTIGTPKGYNEFYDMYNFQDSVPGWKSYHFTWRDAPHLDPKEIMNLKARMSMRDFMQEYEASFEGSGNNVAHSFDRKLNLDKTLIEPQAGEVIHVGIDFNVGIMAAVFCVTRGGQDHFIDEMQGDRNSHELGRRIKEKYIDKGFTVEAYPDPSGRARKTSAVVGETDFTILESYLMRCNAHLRAPATVDAVAASNNRLVTATGEVNSLICPIRCPNFVRSLDRTVWKDGNPDSLQICKKDGVEHWFDGYKYMSDFRYPIIEPPVMIFSRKGLGVL